MNSDSFEKLKPFKLCFNNEIHRISKLPDDYPSLVQTVNLAFKDTLPASWALQYKDADDDFVMLTNDEDFKAMLECEAESSSKSIKIYVIVLNENNAMTFSSISKAESVDYSKITEKQQEEPVSQPIQEEKILEEQQPEITEIQKVDEYVKQEESAPIVEEQVKIEDVSNMTEPCILNQNITKDSAYLDVAVDCNAPVEFIRPVVEERERNNRECRRRRHHHWGSHEERKLAKKEKLRSMVNELMVENMPNMVELMQEYIQNPVAFKEKKQAIPVPNQNSEQTIHYRVTCDGCGVHPIVGVCYKCSVCEDFDYCAKCEQSVEHPHPFLKLKDPKQRPVTLITVLREDYPIHESQQKAKSSVDHSFGESLGKVINDLSKGTQEHVSKALEGISQKIFGNPQPESVPEKVEEVIIPAVVNVEEVVAVQEEPLYNVAFIREICTIPSKITTKDKAIYKTISLKNSGKNEWPLECTIRNISGAKGQDAKVVPLAPGKDFSCIIILENPNVAGDHNSTWSLAAVNKQGNLQNIGEPFTVTFTVTDVAQPKVEKIESVAEVEKKEEVVQKKEYDQKVKEKAQYIKEIFPEVDFSEVLEFISASPDVTVEELIENYLK